MYSIISILTNVDDLKASRVSYTQPKGHRGCDGTVESQFQCVPQAEPGWAGMRP